MKSTVPTIIVVNDEDGLLRAITVMLRDYVTNAEVLSFQNSETAWQELSREDPDLLITDDAMPGLWGQEICRRLLGRKVSYPIIVISGWPPTEEWVKECASRGLNIRFLPCPFDKSEFDEILEASLNVERRDVK